MHVRLVALALAAIAAPAGGTVTITTYTGVIGDVHGDYGASSPFGVTKAGGRQAHTKSTPSAR